MTFVIDAVGLTAAGGRQLALDLLSRLRQFPQHRFVLFVPDLAEYRSVAGANVCSIRFTGPPHPISRCWALERHLPRICNEHRADALLCLGNMAPKRSLSPTAVLIQNAYLVYHEQLASNRLTLREKLTIGYARAGLRRLAARAQFIVQTPLMRERLVRCLRFPLDPDRIRIIPNPADYARNKAMHFSGKSRENAPVFTFLCLTRYYAHKNLEILPQALQQLSRLTSRRFRCFITISPAQHPNAAKLLRRIDTEGLGEILVNAGPVEREALPCVYRSADALILPTLLESYSRTYSEAMHHGLPILTSDRDFARHLCGDAALYFDPLDAVSVAKAMATVMTDRVLRRRLIFNGHRIAAQLPTWDEIAGQFVSVLEQTAAADSRSIGMSPVTAASTW